MKISDGLIIALDVVLFYFILSKLFVDNYQSIIVLLVIREAYVVLTMRNQIMLREDFRRKNDHPLS